MAHVLMIGASDIGLSLLGRCFAVSEYRDGLIEPGIIDRILPSKGYTFSVVEPVNCARLKAARIGAIAYASLVTLLRPNLGLAEFSELGMFCARDNMSLAVDQRCEEEALVDW
ncbi:hypothetical protein ACMDCR_09780 [Labrys okinawensis]|uniref:hypothetical protein n=1 Tax=Labrys okinawensis TaxID=346911 RepID=UPI0039BCB685